MLKKLEWKKDILLKFRGLIELCIAATLFWFLIFNGSLFPKFDFFEVVYGLLAYIVILELVRMISDYTITHHIRISVVVDTFIIFILREVILKFSDKNTDSVTLFSFGGQDFILDQKVFYIILGISIIYFLFKARKWAMEISPDETNCEKCVSKEHCNTYIHSKET